MKPYKIKNKGYGRKFMDHDFIYYEGRSRPGILPESGRGFNGGKHLLELLANHFKDRFKLVVSNKIAVEKGRGRADTLVYVTPQFLRKLHSRRLNKTRDIGLRVTGETLKEDLGLDIKGVVVATGYQKGMFARILGSGFDVRRLSQEDQEALSGYVSTAVKAGRQVLDIKSAFKSKQNVQLLYMQQLLTNFDEEVAKDHPESWWQTYFDENVLYFQDNYINRIPKLQIALGSTKFPDFCLVTTDSYLDVLEIKKPSTELLKHDDSRDNYYWSPELARAIAQTEKYLELIGRHQDAIKNHLRDNEGIELQIVRPRGIIFAGRLTQLTPSAKADDFRRLNMGLKNLQVVPYDEMSRRVRNTIDAIARLEVKKT